MAILETALGAKTEEAAEPLISMVADIDSEGAFGKRTLEVTREGVKVFEPGGALTFQMPMAEIRTARNEPLVGGGRLEITSKTGDILPVIAYSQTVAAQFSEAARGIEQLAKGEEFLISLKTERTRCPNCDRLLPEKDGICPACVNRSKTLWRIGGYLKPYKKQAIGLASLSVLTTLTAILPPQIQGNLIDTVLAPHRNLPHLFLLMGAWLGILVLGAGINIGTARLIAYLGGNIAADLRAGLYRAIEFLQVGYFDKKQVGAITSRVTQDTDRVWGFLVEGVPFMFINGLTLISIISFLLYTNWRLALCIIAPVPFVVIIGAVFWKPMSTMFHKVGQKWARFHMHLN